MSNRPEPADRGFAHRNGWDRAYETYADVDLPELSRFLDDWRTVVHQGSPRSR